MLRNISAFQKDVTYMTMCCNVLQSLIPNIGNLGPQGQESNNNYFLTSKPDFWQLFSPFNYKDTYFLESSTILVGKVPIQVRSSTFKIGISAQSKPIYLHSACLVAIPCQNFRSYLYYRYSSLFRSVCEIDSQWAKAF